MQDGFSLACYSIPDCFILHSFNIKDKLYVYNMFCRFL